MSAQVSPPEAALLFNWDPPQRRVWALGGFLIASLLLHAVSFYLFQVVYEPAVVLLPPPARISLITPTTEEGRSLLRWVDAEDPALGSATQRPPEAKQRALPKLQHIPSYIVEGPKLKHVPPLLPDTRAPSSLPPGPVPTFYRRPAVRLGPVATRVEFSEELTSFGAANLPAARFAASNSESPQAVRFRIALSPRGELRYCFPINSSGDTALDEQARQHLALVRFPQSAKTEPENQSLVWGIATVEWGNDVAPPPSAVKTRPGP
jgi:hypothetical protein